MRPVRRLGIVVFAIVVGLSSALGAQTYPQTPRERTPAEALGGYGGYGAVPTDYPAWEVRAVPPSAAHVVISRRQVLQARRDLSRQINLAQMQFDRSNEVREAQQAEHEAYQELQTARYQALEPVWQDPRYQSAVSLKHEMDEQIEARRRQYEEEVRPEDLVPLASLKLTYATVASDMERAALERDEQVQEARRRLVEAGQRLSELRDEFAYNVRVSPELEQARQNVQQARTDYLAAVVFHRALLDAREIALDYAYYLHRDDVYRNPYYGGGYGYGYGYPHWPVKYD